MINNHEAVEAKNRSNIKKNYFFNVVYQIIAAIAPLITAPYLARILGSSGTGVFSYSSSIVTYFTVLASFGFSSYGQREIAKCQGDIHKQSLVFWEIFVTRLCTVGLSLVVIWSLLGGNAFGDYSLIIFVLSLQVIFAAFDFSFFFAGNEEFQLVSTRNIVIKVLAVVSVYLFVKSKNDVWVYALIVSLSSFLSFLIMIPFLPKRLVKISLHEMTFWEHFRFAFRFFIPTIAIALYSYADKTMIGLLIPGTITTETTNSAGEIIQTTTKIADIENGYYYYADKIIVICYSLITSLQSVMGSRNAAELAANNKAGVFDNLKKSSRFIWFLSFPMVFGICASSFQFVPVLLGNDYNKVIYLLIILSPLIILTGIQSIAGYHYLIPSGHENAYSIATCCSLGANILLNILLIPLFSLYSIGAAIASVLSSAVGTIVCILFLKKYVPISPLLSSIWHYLLAASLMFAAIFPICFLCSPSILITIISIVFGATIYFCVLFLLKDQLVIDFASKTKKRISSLRKRK